MDDNKKKIERDLANIEEQDEILIVEDEYDTAMEVDNIENKLDETNTIYEAEDRVSNVEMQNIAEYEETYTDEINDESEYVEQLESPTVPIPIISDEEVIEKEEQPTEKKHFIKKIKLKDEKNYVDYKIRLAASLIAFVTLFILTVVFLQGAFSLSPSIMINYTESSSLDYKVYLKPNDFYDTNYLGKNKAYIANLIDNVAIDFNYNYYIEEPSNLKFNYSVVAKLTINDGASGNNYFEKEYVLLNNKSAEVKQAQSYNLREQVEIDYAYYNTLANNFKQQYGIDTDSNLTVYLRVNKDTDIPQKIQATDNSTMFVKIPLSEKSVKIELNYQDINNSNHIIKTEDNKTDNIIYGVLSVVSILIAIFIAIKIIRLLSMLRTKKSIYDKYVERILNEYDRLIVENGTGPDLVKNNIIKISRFEELLDVRDNLKLPIMYYVIAKHTKCCFYIKHNRDLYMMTIKAVDLEESNNEKK